MDVRVIGAGAVGGYLAARLALRGHAVGVVARGAQLAAIRANGLRLARPAARRGRARGRPPTRPTRAPADVVVLAVKAHQIAAVAPLVARLLGPDDRGRRAPERPAVVVLRRARWCARRRAARVARPGRRDRRRHPHVPRLGCVTWGSFDVPAPGTIRAGARPGAASPSASPDGTSSPRLATVIDAWTDAGIAAARERRHPPRQMAEGVGQPRVQPDRRALPRDRRRCARLPAEPCARRRDDDRGRGGRRQRRRALPDGGRGAPRDRGDARRGALVDAAGRRGRPPLEVEALLGAVVEIARRTGVATPHLDAMTGRAAPARPDRHARPRAHRRRNRSTAESAQRSHHRRARRVRLRHRGELAERDRLHREAQPVVADLARRHAARRRDELDDRQRRTGAPGTAPCRSGGTPSAGWARAAHARPSSRTCAGRDLLAAAHDGSPRRACGTPAAARYSASRKRAAARRARKRDAAPARAVARGASMRRARARRRARRARRALGRRRARRRCPRRRLRSRCRRTRGRAARVDHRPKQAARRSRRARTPSAPSPG